MPFNLPGDEVDGAGSKPLSNKKQNEAHQQESDYLESENFKSVADHEHLLQGQDSEPLESKEMSN
jgi:hypothetical protein